MPPDPPDDTLPELRHRTFDDALGRRIVDTHIWAVREGLRGADAYHLFDGYCQRLVIDGTPLWRAHAAMETLHPQWNGYGYTWRRDLNAIEPENYPHADANERSLAYEPLLRPHAARARRRGHPRDAPAHRGRPGGARLSDPGRALRAGRHGLFRATLRLRRDGRPLAGIRHRLFVRDRSSRADSATTIRRSCRRPCRRCRWR